MEDQFANTHDFVEGIRTFISALKRVSEIKSSYKTYKSDYLFYYSGLKDMHLNRALKGDPQLNQAFALNLQTLNPQIWEREKIHRDNVSYVFDKEEFVGTSVAEFAERKFTLPEFKGFLLNFCESRFINTAILVVRDQTQDILLDCVTSSKSIDEWLRSNEIIDLTDEYDTNSPLPPRDNQTVLVDKELFERTGYPKNNGRTVYRKIGASQLWVVDSSPKHSGDKAHIEVFDEGTTCHLGTSLYDQINLDTAFKVKNRKINLG